jgi:glycosyltransferase involved in cell wall biosynthesis
MDGCNYPRVLIFGQPFNKSTGGGITLSNLFMGWSKESIAVLFAPWQGDARISTDICCQYYQIGEEEHKWRFPFNTFKQPFPKSGLTREYIKSVIPFKTSKASVTEFLASRIVNPIIVWLGVNHWYSRITLSHRLKKWLLELRPEILYLQVSSLEGIIFACELINFLKVPSIVHMMDDWPSTISTYGIMKKFWRRKIDEKFRILLGSVDIHLSISDAMSDEYKTRYNIKFIPFHNPIDTKIWMPLRKTNFSLNKAYITILFSGRIGTGISSSLLEIASAIDMIDAETLNIKLHIQTVVKEHRILSLLKAFRCVVINPIADYNQIPEIFSKADILLLANDFDIGAVNFLKFSMPTKASEYMISGTPILVYSPIETAVSKFFSKNECGYCLSSQNRVDIIQAIKFLITNEDHRKRISRNAVTLAQDRFDSAKVCTEFQQLLARTVCYDLTTKN